MSHLQNAWQLNGQGFPGGSGGLFTAGGDGGLGAVGGSGRRSTVEDGIRLQQYYEDLLLAPKYWKVEKADEREFEDAIIKFKTDGKGDLLVKVKYGDGSSNGWYEGSVNTAGLVQFNSGAAAPWIGSVNSDGGHLGFNVSYGDGNFGVVIAGGFW